MIDPVSRYLHDSAGRHGPVILMYHSVIPGKGVPGWPWAVSLQRFRSQLDFLAEEGWATPTMAELVAMPDKFRDRTVVITFDDGYVDNLAAWEELETRSMKATLFMVTGSIGKEPTWPADGRPQGRLLSAAELCDLHAAGMEIGSHTVTHGRMTEMDDVRMYQELRESRATIEDTLGSSISSFAYPYGAFDMRCVNAVRESGYHAACTTRTGWALRDGDPCQLRRLTIFNTDTISSLVRKLYFGSNDVSWSTITRYALQCVTSRASGGAA